MYLNALYGFEATKYFRRRPEKNTSAAFSILFWVCGHTNFYSTTKRLIEFEFRSFSCFQLDLSNSMSRCPLSILLLFQHTFTNISRQTTKIRSSWFSRDFFVELTAHWMHRAVISLKISAKNSKTFEMPWYPRGTEPTGQESSIIACN